MNTRTQGGPVQGATIFVMSIACLSGVLGGTQAVATRFALPEIAPLTLAIVRFGIASACIIPIALIWGRVRISGRDFAASVALGVMFFGLFPYLFAAAFQYATAARGALVLGAMPVVTLFLARALGSETLSRGKLIGAMVTLFGVIVVVGQNAFAGDATNPEAWKGDALLLVGVVIGAVFNVGSKPVLSRVPTLAFCAIIMTSGFLAMAMAGFFFGAYEVSLDLPNDVWAAILFLGTLGGFFPIILWNYALARVTPAQSSVAVALNPVTATAGGVLLLSEPLGVSLVLGLILVLTGVVLSAKG
ncbi:MAG: DMT family transporter [Alphaproteobacteria bacterium]